MLDLFSTYQTDEALENHGAWKDIGGGARLLVARIQNPAYGKMLTKLVEQYTEVLKREDDVARAKSDEIMVNVMAETILLGWEGIGYKGKELEYSLANARKMLAIKDFRNKVTDISSSIDNYLAKEEDAQGEA